MRHLRFRFRQAPRNPVAACPHRQTERFPWKTRGIPWSIYSWPQEFPRTKNIFLFLSGFCFWLIDKNPNLPQLSLKAAVVQLPGAECWNQGTDMLQMGYWGKLHCCFYLRHTHLSLECPLQLMAEYSLWSGLLRTGTEGFHLFQLYLPTPFIRLPSPASR